MNKDLLYKIELNGSINKFTEEMKIKNKSKKDNSILTIFNKKINKEVDIDMKNKIFKNAVVTASIIFGLTGATFASSKVIEKIWKDPEKIKGSTEITDEVRKENISLEEAKSIAIEKLKIAGLSFNIVKENEEKEINSNKLYFDFYTDEDFRVIIYDKNWVRISKQTNQLSKKENYITIMEAKKIADEYYKKFGFKDGEFEFDKVQVDVGPEDSNQSVEDRGSRLEVRYYKKYNGNINESQYVNIVINTLYENNFEAISWCNELSEFDNNEIVITKEEAINIAIEYDKNVTDMEIVETKADSKIVKMNDKAYSRKQNYKEFYEPVQNENFDIENRNYYNVESRQRNAWVVVLKYNDKYFKDDLKKRYTEKSFTYYVDATTGEIIGGDMLDGLAYNN